jgi:hypothetical protein
MLEQMLEVGCDCKVEGGKRRAERERWAFDEALSRCPSDLAGEVQAWDSHMTSNFTSSFTKVLPSP